MSEEKKKSANAIECRHAIYSKSSNGTDDIHLIKEQVHQPDGTIKPNLRIIYNYKRPFYIENKGSRDYVEFKEYQSKERLVRYESTQTNLTNAVATALGKPYYRGSMRDLCQEPYIYGVDIPASSIIKQLYAKQWDIRTYYTVAGFDTETDMLHSHGQIMLATLCFNDQVFTVIQKDFVKGHIDPVNRILALGKEYLGSTIEKRGLKFEILLVDKEIDIVIQILKKAHEWKPDFVTVWNIAFDMPKMIEACERANVDIGQLFSDPAVPKEYRSFRWKRGMAKKITDSGKVMNYKPSQQWHTVFCPSSFRWVDGMCAYRQVRAGSAEEPSYGLDAILKKHKLGGKLHFTKADHIKTKPEWHKFMQEHYPLEYVVYNQWDGISMLELDEVTLDLKLTLPMFSESTDLENFNSQPRRTMNELHWFFDDEGVVPGSTSSDMTLDGDDDTSSVSGWITMLPSHQIADNGLKIIEENPEISTNIRSHTAD